MYMYGYEPKLIIFLDYSIKKTENMSNIFGYPSANKCWVEKDFLYKSIKTSKTCKFNIWLKYFIGPHFLSKISIRS